MEASELLSHLSAAELAALAPAIVAWEIGAATDMDAVADYMFRGGPGVPQASSRRGGMEYKSMESDSRPERKYWEAVKKELTVFLCAKDPKYRELWSRIDALENKSTHGIVLLASAYVGERYGFEASVLAGFVAVFFYGVLKVGKEAYCRLALPAE